MSKRNDELTELIQNRQINQATEMIRSAEDYNEGEEFVFTVLHEEKSTPELIEVALESFLGTRENRHPQHGYWVHSLSHFTEILWERRMDRWIKKFNEVSFRGANELRDPNCSNRLVYEFGNYAKFDDDPADFYLTPDNLRWMDWEYAAYSKIRIEAGCFESEEAFLRWKLHHPEAYTAFNCNAQTDLVNIKAVRHLIQKLQEIGADTSEFNGFEKNLLSKQLSELEAKLPAAQDWQRELLEKEIRETRAALV